jgi:hypothetical protein
METFMNGAMMVEAAMLSILLALWMTWMCLSGLFRLLPIRARLAQPCQAARNR